MICGNSTKEHVPRFGKKKNHTVTYESAILFLSTRTCCVGGLHAHHPAADVVFYEFLTPYSNVVCRTLSLCSDHLLNITLDFDQNYEERNTRTIKHVWGADSVFYSFFRFHCVMRMDFFNIYICGHIFLMKSGVCHSVQAETHMAEPQQQQQEDPGRAP